MDLGKFEWLKDASQEEFWEVFPFLRGDDSWSGDIIYSLLTGVVDKFENRPNKEGWFDIKETLFGTTVVFSGDVTLRSHPYDRPAEADMFIDVNDVEVYDEDGSYPQIATYIHDALNELLGFRGSNFVRA